MSYTEFTTLLSNLPGDSQLVELIHIRKAEGEELKGLSKEQRKLRDDWQNFIFEKIDRKEIESDTTALQNLFQSACEGMK